jgi:hypothetical protein
LSGKTIQEQYYSRLFIYQVHFHHTSDSPQETGLMRWKNIDLVEKVFKDNDNKIMHVRREPTGDSTNTRLPSMRLKDLFLNVENVCIWPQNFSLIFCV